MGKKDIENKSDIKILVDAFYSKAKHDSLLGSVFLARINEENWDHHLAIICNFWNAVLFAQPDYQGNAFAKHADLPIQSIHFERWLELWSGTIDEFFEGEKAEEAKSKASKMGALFQSKLDFLRANDNFKNIL